MQKNQLDIQLVSAGQAPWDLLLLADPSRQQIESYLSTGTCYTARLHGLTVGVLVLLETGPGTIEIMNIAVAEDYQGQGIGKQLVAEAVRIARQKKANRLEVGTGNSSIDELAFYQKVGFRMVSIDRDFFLRHYDEPIFENGIQCRDMVRFAMELDPDGSSVCD